MLDANGKTIAKGSRIKCINDVDYGKTYTVTSFAGCLGIENENDPFIPLRDFATENGRLVDFCRIDKHKETKYSYKTILEQRKNGDLTELGTSYDVIVEDIPAETRSILHEAGYDLDEYNHILLTKAEIEQFDIPYDAVLWDLSCEDEEYLSMMMAPADHYLVVAFNSRWTGATGYNIVDDINQTVYRPYEATINPVNITPRGKAMLCRESSHDVPMGASTIIIGLTTREYNRLNEADFNTVILFAEQYRDELT